MRIALTVTVLCLAVVAVAAEKPKKDIVREITLKPDGFPRGAMDKPAQITCVIELAHEFPEAKVQTKINAQVLFEKEYLVYFAWSGSGEDRITRSMEKDENGDPLVVFHLKPGRTEDLRAHQRLFVLPIEASYDVRPAR